MCEWEELGRKNTRHMCVSVQAEWGVALQQREADFAGLMAELASLRRQMSSSAGPSRSSGGAHSQKGAVVVDTSGGLGRVALMASLALRKRPLGL